MLFKGSARFKVVGGVVFKDGGLIQANVYVVFKGGLLVGESCQRNGSSRKCISSQLHNGGAITVGRKTLESKAGKKYEEVGSV